jgi:CBS domain-containing protein
MFVSDLMKYDVNTVAPETTLADAARIMVSQHVSGLPVVEDGKLVGMVTEGDLLRRAEIGTDSKKQNWFRAFFLPSSLADEYVHTHGRFVRDVMTESVMTVFPDTSLAEVANIMCKQRVKRLPVLENGKLIGIIARADLLAALVLHLIETRDPLTENEIGDHILTEMKKHNWAPRSGVTVKVAGHVVDLDGTVFSDAERRAVRVIAETTPGVKFVRDHRVFVDPTSGMSIPVA